MACIGIKISPKLNCIFKRNTGRGDKKTKSENQKSSARGKEDIIGFKKNNFYFSLEVHHHQKKEEEEYREVVMLPSRNPESNVYSWLYSQQEDDDLCSDHYPALSSSDHYSASSSTASSSYASSSSSSEYLTSRASNSSLSPIREENTFSRAVTTATTTADKRTKPARSILSPTSAGRWSTSTTSVGRQSSTSSKMKELHYASTDILSFPFTNSTSSTSTISSSSMTSSTSSFTPTSSSTCTSRRSRAMLAKPTEYICLDRMSRPDLAEPTEYIYLDFADAPSSSEGWMVTKKPSICPVRSAFIRKSQNL